MSGGNDGVAIVFDIDFGENSSVRYHQKFRLEHKNPVTSVSTKQGVIATGAKDGIRLTNKIVTCLILLSKFKN